MCGETVDISFKVIFIVADLTAIYHVLNIYQHNGYYGCIYCTAIGKKIGQCHCYYPKCRSFPIRTPEVNERLLLVAECLRKAGKFHNFCGVKGRSSFACLVDGLPLTAGIYYIHCVLKGVYKDVLKNQVKKLSKTDNAVLNDIIEHLHELKEAV